MDIIGRVDSLWRYPVKSMRGEEVKEALVGFAGVYGDRLFAFKSPACSPSLPYLTEREQAQMLLYRPRFRHPDRSAKPPNLAAAEADSTGLNPAVAEPEDLALDVEAPTGQMLAVDDPALVLMLREGIDEKHALTLIRSEHSMTDCRPVSLFSIKTALQLSEELGVDLDKRRFRANIYMDLDEGTGFSENTFVGKTLQIGSKAVVSVLERDPRCTMITLDPDPAEANPEILRKVVKGHNGTAGIYGAVLVEGVIRPGDTIGFLN